MKRNPVLLAAGLVLLAAGLLLHAGLATAEDTAVKQMMNFGDVEDVAFAHSLWDGMQGYYEDWPMSSDFYDGTSPHGAYLRLYYNIVDIDGQPYHVIVKDNFGGQGASLEMVRETPRERLAAITVMVQMPEGYDPDNNDWFYARYDPDGMVSMKNSMALAGRVGDGTTASCIGCHAKAGGGDYIFTNDE